ncbi:MAG: type II toxin-antitoxin system HicB family antitoxin [Bacteroidales bacterium]|nr:type II toxin-antitoxin system HicB family antitoxin [Bacteroidales bacterium]
MNLLAIIEYDKEVKSYAIYCPELPGCTSCGETIAEAMDNIKEAIYLHLED